MIGLVEEVVYRGYLPWTIHGKPPFVVALLCALAHAAYKVALFVPVPGFDLLRLGLATVVVGIGLGYLRMYSKSLAGCLVFHALFDLLVYGDGAAPWWVW